MNVFLHVGPHKTGTSTLQSMLLGAFATQQPGQQWYPAPSIAGPGHAQLAWQTLGLRGNSADTSQALAILDAARSAEVTTLLLSAEAFALGHQTNLDALSGVFAECDVTLCFTYMDIVKRATSLWQEMVKHGHQVSAADSADRVFDHCSMRKELYAHFLSGLRPQRTCVAFGSSRDSSLLIEAFDACLEYGGAAALGPHSKHPASLVANQSLGFHECEFLLRFNRSFFSEPRKQDYAKFRHKAFALFGSPGWKSRYPRIALPYPLEWRPQIERRANEYLQEIERIEQEHGVRLFGSIERDARQRLDAVDWDHRPETSQADSQFFDSAIATMLQQD